MTTPTQKQACSYCGESHPRHGAICPVYEQHKAEDAQADKQAKCDSTNQVVQKLFAASESFAQDKPERRTQHTPGPWTALSNTCVTVGIPGEGAIALVFETSREGGLKLDLALAEANARLIAAAPELLEACKRLIAGHTIGGLSDAKASKEFARTVIAKAEGRVE